MRTTSSISRRIARTARRRAGPAAAACCRTAGCRPGIALAAALVLGFIAMGADAGPGDARGRPAAAVADRRGHDDAGLGLQRAAAAPRARGGWASWPRRSSSRSAFRCSATTLQAGELRAAHLRGVPAAVRAAVRDAARDRAARRGGRRGRRQAHAGRAAGRGGRRAAVRGPDDRGVRRAAAAGPGRAAGACRDRAAGASRRSRSGRRRAWFGAATPIRPAGTASLSGRWRCSPAAPARRWSRP